MQSALIENGLRFLMIAVGEIETDPTLSVTHFATGIELLLKARLFSEHWSLVTEPPRAFTWLSLKIGQARTIQAKDLVSAISNLTGDTSLLRPENSCLKAAIEPIFTHRNRALHFIPAQGEKAKKIASEQLRAWFYLHELLLGRWKDVYDKHSKAIGEADSALSRHKKYLDVRFQELTALNRFKGPSAKGLLFECCICEYASGIVDSIPSHNGTSWMSCPVCLSEVWVCNRATQAAPEWHPCEEHEGECHHCGDQMIEVGLSYLCLGCGTEFDDADRYVCEWCSSPFWGGIDSDTYSHGCGNCGGSFEYMMSKDD
ncbi:MAG: hypothetical protein KC431_23860 [Myxococcales bacterium]|nr:hypothetical protein [Myxococcales bacterium]